jgi:Domain of unknown function (DUF4276)
MAKYVIVPIVEGRGELEAVPILLRNWLRFRRYRNVQVHADGPVHANGKGNLAVAHDGASGRGVEHYVRLALLRQPQPDIVLIILDADEECPRALASTLLSRARTMVPADFPIGVVVANREYEAWFLAAFASAKFRRSLEEQGFALRQRSLTRGTDVEAIADCKARIATLVDFSIDEPAIRRPTTYKPTVHQPALTRLLPFTPGMARRSRSFRKLLKELHELLMQARRRRSSAEHGPP